MDVGPEVHENAVGCILSLANSCVSMQNLVEVWSYESSH
jgi:hypothetical protein